MTDSIENAQGNDSLEGAASTEGKQETEKLNLSVNAADPTSQDSIVSDAGVVSQATGTESGQTDGASDSLGEPLDSSLHVGVGTTETSSPTEPMPVEAQEAKDAYKADLQLTDEDIEHLNATGKKALDEAPMVDTMEHLDALPAIKSTLIEALKHSPLPEGGLPDGHTMIHEGMLQGVVHGLLALVNNNLIMQVAEKLLVDAEIAFGALVVDGEPAPNNNQISFGHPLD